MKNFIIGKNGETIIRPEFIAQVHIVKTHSEGSVVMVVNQSGMEFELERFNTGAPDADYKSAQRYMAELAEKLNGETK